MRLNNNKTQIMKANEINKKVAYSLTITELKGYLNYMIEHSPHNLKAVLRPDNSVTIEVSEFINSGEAHIIPIHRRRILPATGPVARRIPTIFNWLSQIQEKLT